MSFAGLLMIAVWLINQFASVGKVALVKNLSFISFVSLYIQFGFFVSTDLILVQYWQAASVLGFISILPYILQIKKFKAEAFVIICIILLCIKLIYYPLVDNVVVGFEGSYENSLGNPSLFFSPYFSKFTVYVACLAIINVLIAGVMRKELSYTDQAKLINTIATYTRYYFIYIVVEIATKYIGGIDNYYEFMKFVWGITGSNMELELRHGIPMIHGVMREGSHLAYSASFGILILYADYKINQSKISLFFLNVGVVILFVSMSFSVIVVAIIMILMCFIYCSNSKVKHLFAILVLLFFFVLSYLPSVYTDYYLGRIVSLYDDIILFTEYKPFQHRFTELSSGMARMATIYNNLYTLNYSPFFGTGIATNSSHSSLSLMISETGIIGTFVFLYYYIAFVAPKYKTFLYYSLIVCWLLVVFLIPIAQPTMIVRIDFILVPMLISKLVLIRKD